MLAGKRAACGGCWNDVEFQYRKAKRMARLLTIIETKAEKLGIKQFGTTKTGRKDFIAGGPMAQGVGLAVRVA